MTQPEHVGDHRVTMTQAEKHQVPQVQQRAQQHEPQYPILEELSGSHLALQRYVLPVLMSQAEKHQAGKLTVQLRPNNSRNLPPGKTA